MKFEYNLYNCIRSLLTLQLDVEVQPERKCSNRTTSTFFKIIHIARKSILDKLILLPWSKQGIVDQPNNFSTFYSKCICILIPTLIQCKIFGMKGINPMVLQLVECEFSRFLYVHKSGFVETFNVLWDYGNEKCSKLKRHFHSSGYVTDIIWMRK